jgi:predicted metal-dependent HD superfamily phosphohydrolase
MKLQQTFLDLSGKYTANASLRDRFWHEIASAYSGGGRRYHTLNHLEHMFLGLEPVRAAIHDWDAVLFALYYHDIVYDPASDQNEVRSAGFGAARLGEIACPPARIQRVVQMILATRDHAASEDGDTNYFTDADLSVFGKGQADYLVSSRQIRQEYSIYPDAVYNPGRKRVIQHFLAMPRIFKTAYFHEKLEHQARENLANELGE